MDVGLVDGQIQQQFMVKIYNDHKLFRLLKKLGINLLSKQTQEDI
jgi:hypothetical protein